MDLSNFKHISQVRVRNYEVDWQGIVHNVNYLLYFEIGRIEYLKHIGVHLDLHSVKNESRVVLVRNEVDYRSPAKFDEVLQVHSRISYIRNTSFAFEGIILEETTRRLVAENIAIHVWLDPRSGSPVAVSEGFRRDVLRFEGGSIQVQGGLNST